MVKAVSSASSNLTNTSIFYINDQHSQVANMERLKNASDAFDSFVPSKKTDKLKFSPGDFALGEGRTLNALAVAAQNSLGIMASAVGNHELDLNKKDLVDVLKNNNYKLLGLNLEIPQTTAENKELRKEVTNSYIQEVNGVKYGVIGLLPFDFFAHVTDKKEYEDFNVLSVEKTIPLLQKEVDNFEKQGINKVILLSHAGFDIDQKIAQSVEGIDVILGGHTHDVIKGIEKDKNLFYSKKTGNPTIITQAGKNGDYFGVLNLQFDENGVIKVAQNNVIKTENFPKSLVMRYFINQFLGTPNVIGRINSAPNEKPSLIKENPSADFVNDAMREELQVDCVIMNSGNMRANLEQGPITDRDIEGLTPFKNKMCIVKVTEKELVDAIKFGAKSLTDVNYEPGIIQVSGLKYKLTHKGEVKEITYIDKEGKETPIDVNNPSTTKTYRLAIDSFLAKGGNGHLPEDKWDKAEQKFDFDKSKLVIDHVQKLKKPIDIKTDGRIQFVD